MVAERATAVYISYEERWGAVGRSVVEQGGQVVNKRVGRSSRGAASNVKDNSDPILDLYC